jgi:hypothetical protein
MSAPTCPNCRALLPPGSPGAVVVCAVCHVRTRLPAAPVAALVPPGTVGAAEAPAALPVALPVTPLPPIAFSCPTCQARLQAEASAAGAKTICPRCGQKLLIPQSPRPAPVNRTVLGRLEPSPAAVGPPPPPSAALARDEEVITEAVDDDEPLPRPRQRGRRDEPDTRPRARKSCGPQTWIKSHPWAAAGLAFVGAWMIVYTVVCNTGTRKPSIHLMSSKDIEKEANRLAGATKDRVRSALGEPLEVREYPNGNQVWIYATRTTDGKRCRLGFAFVGNSVAGTEINFE